MTKLIWLLARLLKPFFSTPTKIARIRSKEYLQNKGIFKKQDGFHIDVVIAPEMIVKDHIIRLIQYPGALQVLDFADGLVQLVGAKAVAGGALINQPISELKHHMQGVESRVAAIYRDGEVITPKAETIIYEGDEVFFVAAQEHISALMREIRGASDKTKRIIIAGGGKYWC